MIRIVRFAFIITILIFLSPAVLFANIYETAEFNPHRETLSQLPYEHIDTFTGGVLLKFIDAQLPGNGGLDLVIQRVYNSKIWTGGSLIQDSWVGMGWTLHFGCVHYPNGSNPVIEMPDGSKHTAYMYATSKFRTEEYWIYDNSNPSAPTLKFTDGRKITFGKLINVNNNIIRYATKIEDVNNNVIQISYKDYATEAIIDYIMDSLNRRITFTTVTAWDTRPKLYSISGPGIDISYTVQRHGTTYFSVLRYVAPPLGNPWEYEYDSNYGGYELKKIITPAGGTISYSFAQKTFWIGGQAYDFRALTTRTTGGRVIPAGTWNFSYVSGFSGSSNDGTTITDLCSRTTTYQHYGQGAISLRGERTNIRFTRLTIFGILESRSY